MNFSITVVLRFCDEFLEMTEYLDLGFSAEGSSFFLMEVLITVLVDV